MEGGGCPINPRQPHSDGKLPNKGIAREEDDPNKSKNREEEGDGNRKRSQAVPPAAANTAMAGVGSCVVREQDRLMPIANIIRIMRKSLPTHAKIADDTKETVQACVSDFIAYVTSEANERCHQEQRKTITAEDALWALTKLGFDQYVEYLSMYMHCYRLVEGDHRPSRRELLSPAINRAATTPAVGPYHGLGLDVAAQGYPARFFPDEGGSSSVASAGGVRVMPENHQRDAAGTQAGPSQGPHLFGFDPFARHN